MATTSVAVVKPKLPTVYTILTILLVLNILLAMDFSSLKRIILQQQQQQPRTTYLSASAFSVGRFGWPGLEWREIIDWWTSGYSRGVVIGRNYIPPCKLCDMPRMFRVD